MGVWLTERRGPLYVLYTMWMGCPYQTGSLQGHPCVSGGGLAGNDSGTGSGWQQNKQDWALPARGRENNSEWHVVTPATGKRCDTSLFGLPASGSDQHKGVAGTTLAIVHGLAPNQTNVYISRFVRVILAQGPC